MSATEIITVPDPQSLRPQELIDQCSAIEIWAAECDFVLALRKISSVLAAYDEYLAHTSTKGRARVAAARRRLEMRIGELLGAAVVGSHSSATQGAALSADERRDFRQMAAHLEVVEKVIAESDDEHPASRRAVLRAVHTPSAPDDRGLRLAHSRREMRVIYGQQRKDLLGAGRAVRRETEQELALRELISSTYFVRMAVNRLRAAVGDGRSGAASDARATEYDMSTKEALPGVADELSQLGRDVMALIGGE